MKTENQGEFWQKLFSANIGLYSDIVMSVSSFEVNAAAAMRDYYVEPRLGRDVGGFA